MSKRGTMYDVRGTMYDSEGIIQTGTSELRITSHANGFLGFIKEYELRTTNKE
ncbi:hypothetical protein JCM17380_38620 [Desulfosporosinus burensis]